MSLDLTLDADATAFDLSKTLHQFHMKMIEASAVDMIFTSANPLSEQYEGNQRMTLSGLELRNCLFLNSPDMAGRMGYISFQSPVGCQTDVTMESPIKSPIKDDDMDDLLFGNSMKSTDASGLNLDILPPDTSSWLPWDEEEF